MDNGIIFNNRILDIVLVALIIAQVLKVIFGLFRERKLNFRYLLDMGSMPSSHTASVVSLTTAVGIKNGLNSTLFAISIVFAIVVMYDATGIRQAAGKQAALLNKIVDNIRKKEGYSLIEENLRELLGHTKMEVLVGALIGAGVAFLMS